MLPDSLRQNWHITTASRRNFFLSGTSVPWQVPSCQPSDKGAPRARRAHVSPVSARAVRRKVLKAALAVERVVFVYRPVRPCGRPRDDHFPWMMKEACSD